MTTLSTFGLAGALAVAQAACVIDSPDDSAFTLGWTVQHVGDATTTSCIEVGAATVELEVENESTKVKYSDSFACTLGSGRSRMLPAASYIVVVRLKDDVGAVISETAPARFGIDRTGFTDLPTVGFLVQSWKLSWSIQKMTASTPVLVTCAQAGAATVQLETQFAGAQPQKYDFPCEVQGRMEGQTTAIGVGSYVVTVRLLNAAGATLSTTASDIVAVNDTQRADLGPIQFTVN